MSNAGRLLPALALAACFGSAVPATAARENVVFILLDATRADRFGAWGNPHPTTPWLDRLAAEGAIFLRHFANAHATRASMPQLMSGRYYRQTILRPFSPKEHPREYPFSRPDSTAALLPEVLRQAGYRTLGVSAHPWVVAESTFGQQFDRLDFIGATPERGHADAAEVMDRVLTVWRERDASQPAFLYVHLMDMHMPRFLPESEPRFAVAGYDWRERFEPRGEPMFNYHERRWAQNDARAFTEHDRRHFEAVYDTRLHATDEQIGRLLTALRRDDPDLRRTIVVVTADHGEELGEDGRIEHLDSLADGVQHVPWIVSGGPVEHGQQLEQMSEHVDVTPTLLTLLGLRLPSPARADGRSQLDADGRLCARCGKAAVYFAYEEYRGIRTNRYLLRRPQPDTFQARCTGEEQVYRIDGLRRAPLEEGRKRQVVAARLRGRLERRLDPLERAFRARRYGPPAESFLVRSEFWSLPAEASVGCVRVDEDTDREQLGLSGWLWSGRGVTVLHPGPERPLPVTVPAPSGLYKVDVAMVRVEDMPWESGLSSVRWLGDYERGRFARWRARNFLQLEPSEYMPLGEASAVNGSLTVGLPAGIKPKRIVAVRLTPPGVPSTTPARPETQDEKTHHDRLKALGYVN